MFLLLYSTEFRRFLNFHALKRPCNVVHNGGGRRLKGPLGQTSHTLLDYPVIVPAVQLLHCKWRDETSTVAFHRNCRWGNACTLLFCQLRPKYRSLPISQCHAPTHNFLGPYTDPERLFVITENILVALTYGMVCLTQF